MRKGLIIGTLALAVVTSMTAGTLATYTKSVDFTGSTNAKRFYFDASTTETIDIALAPGESQEWNFEATNTDENGNVAEVSMYMTVKVNLPQAMKDAGVTAKVHQVQNGTPKPLPTLVAEPGTYLDYEFGIARNVSAVQNYRIVFTWENVETKNDVHTRLGEAAYQGPVTVTVTGRQYTDGVPPYVL